MWLASQRQPVDAIARRSPSCQEDQIDADDHLRDGCSHAIETPLFEMSDTRRLKTTADATIQLLEWTQFFSYESHLALVIVRCRELVRR